MLYPRKNGWFNGWFVRVIDKRLRQTFARLTVHGLEHLPQGDSPLLLVANHSCYWDALLIVWLSVHVLHKDAYAWMHAHNLRRLPFFRLLGAFGVDRQSRGDIKAAMTFAQKLLEQPRRAVWIFPQGDEQPLGRRPLAFQGGSAFLARRAPSARTLPVALHYAFGRGEKPIVQVCLGAPLAAGTDAAGHEAAVARLCDACRDEDPVALAACSPGVRTWFDTDAAKTPWRLRFLSYICARILA